jgi:glycosyltransferase involved in cell wall biosynthesis
MSKEHYIVVVIPTFNCVNEIKLTIESVVNQTIESEMLKIVAIDNCSTDGTYETLLEFAKKNMKQISVFRLSKTMKWPRVYKKLAEQLRFKSISYSTLLLTCYIVYHVSIERFVTFFKTIDNFEGKVLISEVDLIDENGSKKFQKPIFTDNCVLKAKMHNSKFLTTGIEHKIQAFYRGLPVLLEHNLIQIVDLINYNDWFYKFFHNFGDSIYINESFACIKETQLNDPIYDLLNRLLILKKHMYRSSMNEQSFNDELYLDNDKYSLAYKCLANLALKYAIKEIKSNRCDIAYNCLLFSEMTCLDIVNSDIYVDINSVLLNKLEISCLEKYVKQVNSIKPPIDCFIF